MGSAVLNFIVNNCNLISIRFLKVSRKKVIYKASYWLPDFLRKSGSVKPKSIGGSRIFGTAYISLQN